MTSRKKAVRIDRASKNRVREEELVVELNRKEEVEDKLDTCNQREELSDPYKL